MINQENDKEQAVRQEIETRITPSERLLSYTTGKIFGVSSAAYRIGLTGDRLILLPLKRGAPAEQAYAIRRDRIKSLKLKWSGLTASRMEVRFPSDGLDFTIQGGNWRKRAQELARLAAQPTSPSVDDPVTRSRQHLQQALDFQELGLTGLAHDELIEAERANSLLVAQPAVIQPLKEQLAESRLAMRVAAGFCFGYLGVISLLTGLAALFGGGSGVVEYWDLELVISLIVALWFGIHLWRGQRQARITTVYAAFVSFILFGLLPLLAGDFVALLSQGAFSGSIMLVLTGKSSRIRTWAAIGIYVVGYLGILALAILITFLAALAGSL